MSDDDSKRKSEHGSSFDQPYKKHRPENGTLSTGAHSQGKPPLPPIATRLEKAVFTHASLAVQDPDKPEHVNYERLEFLGDAHLELMASQVIFERYSSSTPGKMSAIREELVKNDVICKFARHYGLDKRLNIGIGNMQPRDWVKIHGDLFEAYICAVVLSDPDPHNGFDTAKKWATALWEPILSRLGMTMVTDVKSKEELGKALLAPAVKLNYVNERQPVADKAKGTQTYFIGVYLNGLGCDNQHLGSGTGQSKNAAGQEAARKALENPLLDILKAKRAAYLEQRGKERAAKVQEAEKADVKDGGDVGIKEQPT
ncbi:hypothetical protein LTR70_005761 [Exophiala xenobiotica]|uniref:RNase III domain-containing protein n=1 Tax=Lithohypha guttulata TaxID=1690604 RepID=A0ABR0K9T9_9EURO|nr:hypothetical protein LTR24_005498 [Lithohypha guttulata]KAK5317655.1 hypothetical protein LTR70_005761 [Exophiala xenobiotica]